MPPERIPALPADQSQRPPVRSPEQPEEKAKPPELPPLHFPQRPDGQGLAPAPGGQPPPPPAPQNGAPPPPQSRPEPPPGQGPQWGPGGPVRPAGPNRPLRPPEQTSRHRAGAGLILGLMSLVALMAMIGIGGDLKRAIYLVIFSLVVGLGACWFGAAALQHARRAVTMRPHFAVAGIVTGAIGAALAAVLLIGFIAFWPQLNTYSQCLNSANTPSAQQACQDQLHRSVGVTGPAG